MFERQLAEHGIESLIKSAASLENLILKHLQKIESANITGGFVSSIEREIINFQEQINAINKILGK